MSNRNKHIGSSIEDYFKTDGTWEEIKLQAEKELLVDAIERRMAKLGLSKAEVARRMGTSRSRLDAVLNPKDTGLTMKTIASVCSALGLDFSVQLSPRRRASA